MIDLHTPETNVFYLITVYSKDQKDNLSGEERRLNLQLVQVLKQRARPSEGV